VTPLFLSCLGALVMAFCLGSVGFTIPLLLDDWKTSNFLLGIIPSTGALTFLSAAPFMGRLSDRVGQRPLICVVLLVWGASMASIPFLPRPEWLFLFLPISGLAAAGYWPSLESYFFEASEGKNVVKGLRFYNMGWTLGLAVGPLIAGFLYSVSPKIVFFLVGGAVFALSFLFLKTPAPGKVKGLHHDEPHAHKRFSFSLLVSAWIGVFLACLFMGCFRNLFPRLGRSELLLSEPTIGTLISLYFFCLLVLFPLLGGRDFWVGKRWPLLAALLFEGVGVAAVFLGSTPFFIGSGIALVAVGYAQAYSAGLFYAMTSSEEKRGFLCGCHEGIIGTGFFLGPAMGGAVSTVANLRTPYAVIASLVGLGFLLAAGHLRKDRLKQRQASRPKPHKPHRPRSEQAPIR